MRPIYTPPSFDKKPSSQTASNKSASGGAKLNPKPQANIKKQPSSASSPKHALASSPSMAAKPKSIIKPITFRPVTREQFENLINDDSALEKAIQDKSIFEIQFGDYNGLWLVACRLEKFDLATRLLDNPLADEAFLKDQCRLGRCFTRLLKKPFNDTKNSLAFLKTLMQRVDLQALTHF